MTPFFPFLKPVSSKEQGGCILLQAFPIPFHVQEASRLLPHVTKSVVAHADAVQAGLDFEAAQKDTANFVEISSSPQVCAVCARELPTWQVLAAAHGGFNAEGPKESVCRGNPMPGFFIHEPFALRFDYTRLSHACILIALRFRYTT